MITIRQLTNTPIEEIHRAFQNAFSDYAEPFDLTQEQLQYMIERRGYDAELSFGAFDGNELVGFTLNGIGDWNNIKNAYDTGTGIVKEYRRQGFASRIFNDSVPVLKGAGVKQYLLEVIKTNKSAYDLYKKAGFKVTREFDYYTASIDRLKINYTTKIDGITIKEIDNPDWNILKSFWDFEPSWQNSIASINRKADHLRIIGTYKNDELIGYGIVEPDTGDIPQIAINKDNRRKGIGRILFSHLIKLIDEGNLKIINIPSDNESFKHFAKSLNLTPGFGQYEMILEI